LSTFVYARYLHQVSRTSFSHEKLASCALGIRQCTPLSMTLTFSPKNDTVSSRCHFCLPKLNFLCHLVLSRWHVWTNKLITERKRSCDQQLLTTYATFPSILSFLKLFVQVTGRHATWNRLAAMQNAASYKKGHTVKVSSAISHTTTVKEKTQIWDQNQNQISTGSFLSQATHPINVMNIHPQFWTHRETNRVKLITSLAKVQIRLL